MNHDFFFQILWGKENKQACNFENKLTTNFMGLVTSALVLNVAHGLPVGPRGCMESRHRFGSNLL